MFYIDIISLLFYFVKGQRKNFPSRFFREGKQNYSALYGYDSTTEEITLSIVSSEMPLSEIKFKLM